MSPVISTYDAPSARSRRLPDLGGPALPGSIQVLGLVGKGQNYYTAEDEQVVRGSTENGVDALTHTGVLRILNIIDEYGESYTQGPTADYVLSGNSVSWEYVGSGSLGTPTNYINNTMASKTHVSRKGGEYLSSDVYMVHCHSPGSAGVGTYSVRSLIEGITATNVISGTTRTDIIPGVQLYVQDTLGAAVGDGCSFTNVYGYNAKEPAPGVKYFVTYDYLKSETDYEPKTFYKLDDVRKEYGEESSDNTLTIGANLAFQNSAQKIVCVPVYGLVEGMAEPQIVARYKEAIDKLKEEDINVLVVLYPSDTLAAYIKAHVDQMSSTLEKKERIAVIGAPIGTSIENFIAKARALSDSRCIYVAPDGGVATINDVTYTLDGTYLAAALGGLLTNPNYDVAETPTLKEIVGFDSLNSTYIRSQMNSMAAAGVCILENKNGIIRVRHALTTDTSTVNRQEISVQRITDYLAVTLRTILEKIYIPVKITSEVPGQVKKTTTIVLDMLVSARIISNYSDVDAIQNAQDPRIIDVTLKVKPVYPLNWIDISFALGTF